MKTHTLLRKAHKLYEIHANVDISKRVMAKLLNVNSRTYDEYLKGTNQPIAMKTILNLLSRLPDKSVMELLDEWRSKEDDE